jgi:hypothetical protein
VDERRKHRLALVIAPHLFAEALAAVLSADDVDDVIDLTAFDHPGATPLASRQHFDTAVISPGAQVPDADVVIVLPPSGAGQITVTREGRTDRVEVASVAALLDLLDDYSPGGIRRRRPA